MSRDVFKSYTVGSEEGELRTFIQAEIITRARIEEEPKLNLLKKEREGAAGSDWRQIRTDRACTPRRTDLRTMLLLHVPLPVVVALIERRATLVRALETRRVLVMHLLDVVAHVAQPCELCEAQIQVIQFR